MTQASTLAAPSDWVKRHAELIPQGGRALDLACGAGRHTRWLLAQGFSVLAVDRNLAGLADLRGHAALELRELDLETTDWPLTEERLQAVVVSNYLHRPHLARLIDCLTPDGVLIYSTFASGNEAFGRPRNPDFLLQPGELRRIFSPALHVVAFAEGETTEPRPAVRQSICAVGPKHPIAN